MKKNYFVLLIALISFSTYAQNVNIPDDTFLQALIDAGVDANSDGIIQVSEAQATTNLTLFCKRSKYYWVRSICKPYVADRDKCLFQWRCD